MFLHFGIVHLALNTWSLWDVGQLAERMYGRWRFLCIYIISGLAGNLVSLVVQGNSAVSGGASGAIFGSTMDSEIFVHLMANPVYASKEEAVLDVVKKVEGAYSLVILSENQLFGVRVVPQVAAVIDLQFFRQRVNDRGVIPLGRLANQLLSCDAMRSPELISPADVDIDLLSRRRLVFGLEPDRCSGLGSQSHQRRMNRVSLCINRNDRLMLLGLALADQHLEQPLAQTKLPAQDHFLIRNVEPDCPCRIQGLGCRSWFDLQRHSWRRRRWPVRGVLVCGQSQ